jgi:spermidine synthase
LSTGWSTAKVAPLLFGSGLCALVYQVAWQREFRLVFGASTGASAAVLAIFIGGMGIGGLALGKRADAHRRPLVFYAQLEAVIAAATAITPALLVLVRAIYVQLGGTVVLGATGGTVLRTLLAALVLAVPTFCMGGTLPAAARSIAGDDDPRRRGVAVLYATNTVGAVTGCVISNFYLLEAVGTRRSLWLACALNALIAAIALLVARTLRRPVEDSDDEDRPAVAPAAAAPAWLALGAAAVVGFVFFLMELVWYRMLAPLLGGSVFTFGLILAVALLGIGLGGVIYALAGRRRPPSLAGFAAVCSLEAAFIAAPYALGDRVALIAMRLRPGDEARFIDYVLGWAAVAGIVAFPAAVVAGYQYPMLIALLGAGRRDVGRQIGLATAWNTAGAMAGSLAGGFGLMPAFTAPGCWRLAVGVLVALAGGAAVLGFRASQATTLRRVSRVAPAAVLSGLAIAALTATGPTAAWRHSPIGAGRVDPLNGSTPNFYRYWQSSTRRAIRWEAEGVESSVALDHSHGLAFLVNGKVDGNSRGDAATQVMGGLLGAILHPAPKRAMVIGFGTGSTAGWLGAVPSIEHVDVAELEPAIIEVARACAPVNQDVLSNPKVRVILGDARETLLTIPGRYDIVFSEPSNPYRAGVAGLFTQEYYRAVAARLEDDGLLLQWVQGYEITPDTIKTIYATLASVFPEVETWRLSYADLVLVAGRRPPSHDVARMRARVAEEPFRSALSSAWRVTDLEGVLAHFVARAELAREVARGEHGAVNTDDENEVEFGFARSVGRNDLGADALIAMARERRWDTPPLNGAVDWTRVQDERIAHPTGEGQEPDISDDLPYVQQRRATAQVNYAAGNLSGALTQWREQEREPIGPTEIALVAEGMAEAGDEAALGYIEKLRAFQPAEADAILGRLRLRQGRIDDATTALEACVTRLRRDPWASTPILERALVVIEETGEKDITARKRLFAALIASPFAVYVLDDGRLASAHKLSERLDLKEYCGAAIHPLEPHVPWRLELLTARRDCYEAIGDPRHAEATADVERFMLCPTVPAKITCW